MALPIIDIDGVLHTVYATVAKADQVLAVDPVRSASWSSASEANKKIYLIAASRRFDVLSWRGKRVDVDALEAWPRTGLTYEDGTDVPDDAVPEDVETATCLLAGSIAQSSANANVVGETRTISRVRAGSAEVEFSGSGSARRTQAANKVGDEYVHSLIARWLAGAIGITGGQAFGTDGKSSFTSPNPYATRQY